MDFIEKLKSVFKENNIEVLLYTGEKDIIKYKCLKCGEIYEYKCARNLFSKITLCKKCCSPFNRWNKERVSIRLKRLFPESSLEIISFNSFKKGGTIKCNKCGEEEEIKNFGALLCARKEKFCNNCEKQKNTIYNHLQEELNKGKIALLQWNGVNKKSVFKCLRCGHIFSKNVTKNFNGNICPNCFRIYNKFSFEQAQSYLNNKWGSEYVLLQYKGMQEKSLVKHKCGFCFSTRLSNCEKIRGCPKCYKKSF